MIVYCITSPSNKHYVGITRTTLNKRFAAHLRRAADVRVRHPLYDAMRKYGVDAFRVDALEDGLSEQDAKYAEIVWIRVLQATDRRHGYNLSPGGDYDAETGTAAFRARLADPAFKTAYIQKLSAVKKSRDWTDYVAMTKANLKWRRANARQAYYASRRAARLATKAQGRVWMGGPGVILGYYDRFYIDTPAVLEARRSHFHKRRARFIWANRSEEDKAALSATMSEAARRTFADSSVRRANNAKQLGSARAGIDRVKQGKAASAGLKAWWAEIKKNPEAYAKLMEQKRAKLKARANLRHSKRGTTESVFS